MTQSADQQLPAPKEILPPKPADRNALALVKAVAEKDSAAIATANSSLAGSKPGEDASSYVPKALEETRVLAESLLSMKVPDGENGQAYQDLAGKYAKEESDKLSPSEQADPNKQREAAIKVSERLEAKMSADPAIVGLGILDLNPMISVEKLFGRDDAEIQAEIVAAGGQPAAETKPEAAPAEADKGATDPAKAAEEAPKMTAEAAIQAIEEGATAAERLEALTYLSDINKLREALSQSPISKIVKEDSGFQERVAKFREQMVEAAKSDPTVDVDRVVAQEAEMMALAEGIAFAAKLNNPEAAKEANIDPEKDPFVKEIRQTKLQEAGQKALESSNDGQAVLHAIKNRDAKGLTEAVKSKGFQEKFARLSAGQKLGLLAILLAALAGLGGGATLMLVPGGAGLAFGLAIIPGAGANAILLGAELKEIVGGISHKVAGKAKQEAPEGNQSASTTSSSSAPAASATPTTSSGSRAVRS